MHGAQGQRQGLARTDFAIRLPPSGEVCLACQHTSMVQVSDVSDSLLFKRFTAKLIADVCKTRCFETLRAVLAYEGTLLSYVASRINDHRVRDVATAAAARWKV